MLLNDMHNDWDNSDNDTRAGLVTLNTNGCGYWSEVAKAVRITELRMNYVSEEKDFGELCVHFNTDDWRPDVDGLIYTDKLFMSELRAYLTTIGIDGADVSYSEQGMQGDNYVSCDVGAAFVASYAAKYPDKLQALWDDLNG